MPKMKIWISNIGTDMDQRKVWSLNIKSVGTGEVKITKAEEYFDDIVTQNIVGFTSEDMWDLYNAIHSKLAELT